MNQRILNRAGKLPDDGFYQVEALGEHINHEAKVVQVIDAKAVTAILNRFTAEAKAAGADFPGKPLDRDHLSDSSENTSEAYGWGMELRPSATGYEAKIDWTAIGEPLVTPKDGKPPAYKFFSTGYNAEECEKIGTRVVGKKTYDVVRPLRLDSLSLTNQPNNKGQRPISNRKGNPAGAAEHKDTPMKSVLKMLGLAEDASEESAVAAVQKITNRATAAETERDTLKKDNEGLLAAQVESDLEKYKNRFKPEKRDAIKGMLIKNRAGTIELLENTEAPAAEDDSREQDPAKITNRKKARTPEEIAAEKKTASEEARAAKISNRARAIRAATPRVSLNDAYLTATAEVDAEAK